MYSKQNKTSSDAIGPISVTCTLNKTKLAVMPLVQYLLYVLSKQNKTSSDAIGPISVICTLNKTKLAVMPLVQYLLQVL